jgi:hypothetical protein
VRYRDLRSKSEYRAADLSLATGPVVQQGALDVAAPRLTLLLAGTALPEAGIPIALEAERVTFVPGSGTLDLPGLRLAAGDTHAIGEFAIADNGRTIWPSIASTSTPTCRNRHRRSAIDGAPGRGCREPACYRSI